MEASISLAPTSLAAVVDAWAHGCKGQATRARKGLKGQGRNDGCCFDFGGSFERCGSCGAYRICSLEQDSSHEVKGAS